MSELVIKVGALNIAASPHPKGIYRSILEEISNKEVPFWGSDRAKITPFEEIEDNSNHLFFRILIWTHLDPDGNWLNKRKNVEATPAEKKEIEESLPKGYEPNYKSFNAVFVEDKHRLILEYRNELGHHLGARRAEKLFQRLFNRHVKSEGVEVEVTFIPEEESLDRIFAIPRLSYLEIFVKRPNAGDDVHDEGNEILSELVKQGAKSQTIGYAKAAKVKSLSPNARTKKIAKLASTNGYVAGWGKNASGKKLYESTSEHPKEREIEIPENSSSFAAFYRAVRFFV
jgi:hypothetical protein